ncbi:hypothetical protein [Pontivivens nitratireducens]|jgi:hypothetical protein|uniref:Uncharacterized protein n=1 Tax=Pontivivens nitratireducens TaxID=2758038 RepID=A0A6G7VH49_9RHOB|nr:hypothetical protein [Pontibrevibacter nitratireducens]QIK39413.1 hypothetical protein G8E03_00765 [Pontibrevibacter nitratireducens]
MYRILNTALIAITLIAMPIAAQAENSHLGGLTGLSSEQLADMTLEEIALVIQSRGEK